MSDKSPHFDPIDRRTPAPAWQIWANPIVRRYARSRLRPKTFGVYLLVILLLAAFMYFGIRGGAKYRGDMSVADAARAPLIPLLWLQGIILFLLGTGQVAGAMTAEADEGVLDYQRLAPMTPLTKVLGYLFGLPIREYALVLATMPFTILGVLRGGVPLNVAVPLYVVFFSSAILYHLTGLVCGTCVKNRRWAFLASMAVVFLLYTVVPVIANFGLVYFKYLTLAPVYWESLPELVPRDAGAGLKTLENLSPSSRFLNLDFPQSAFTLLTQSVLILTGIVMLWRRWRRSESHLLGKAWAVGLFAWVQVLLIGNVVPLLESGQAFPSQGFNRFARQFGNPDWRPDPEEAMVMVGMYGLVTLVFLWILTTMITPVRETQIRGWRRARKFGKSSLAPVSDPATAFWSVAIMVGIASVGWIVFAREILGSRWFPGWMPTSAMPIAFVVTMVGAGLGFHALLESRGGKLVGLAVILVGFVPIGLAIIAGVTSNKLAAHAVWLLGISPLSGPFYASGVTLPQGGMPAELSKPLPGAFWFWRGIYVLVSAWLVAKLIAARKAVAKQTLAGEDRVTKAMAND